MNIIRLIIEGVGAEVVSGTMLEKDFISLDKSGVLEDVWVRDLYKRKIKNNFNFKETYKKIGLVNGDVSIIIDGQEEYFSPISVTPNQDIHTILTQTPNNFTVIQNYKGVFLDTTFVLNESFDVNNLKINKFYLVGNLDNINVPYIFCDVSYGGVRFGLNTKNTEMITSKILNNFIV